MLLHPAGEERHEKQGALPFYSLGRFQQLVISLPTRLRSQSDEYTLTFNIRFQGENKVNDG